MQLILAVQVTVAKLAGKDRGTPARRKLIAFAVEDRREPLRIEGGRQCFNPQGSHLEGGLLA